ncbi:hypothetical protein LTR36_005954 [Oleoguttula mirabilis]|uniref:Fungal lipase-type domain-containing protein n=1 Tax=Oleoguttula mirabilis TaxID=1507867 RepID=A0AAV9JCI8_9PEZI|nr:hypothetical protein LTR36_005954 [Oleoguttula mirabilis]
MQFFHIRNQRPVGPVEASLRPTQKQRLQSHAAHSYSTAFPAAQLSCMALPMTPPPQYQECDNGFLHPQHNIPDLVMPYHSQQNMGLARPVASYGQPSAWASTSTLDAGMSQSAAGCGQEQRWQANTNLAVRPATAGRNDCAVARTMNQGSAFCDRVARRLNDLLYRADGDIPAQDELEVAMRAVDLNEHERYRSPCSDASPSRTKRAEDSSRCANQLINFKKSWLYQNSRLPPGMVPFNVYLPTWTLVCRAAQASIDVYNRPPKNQRDYYTDADPKLGTKATIVKSQPIDDRKLIVVAIRGTKWNMVDWTVNFTIAPTQPVGFLDDEGNACHAGFLEVARAMVRPVAAQLRRLIEEDPSWATSSVLFTGHSAGGAVASLLYAHMLARTVESELTVLAGVFKRVHCITFGCPPLSLLPLHVPNDRRESKNQFLAFANEGDLIVRADKAYLGLLLRLLAAPAPSTSTRTRLRERVSRQQLRGGGAGPSTRAPPPYWPVPDATLSNAGRLVLLREKPRSRAHSVEAVQITDEELRDVVFGDPAMHPMTVYKRRLDALAFAAVSGSEADVAG